LRGIYIVESIQNRADGGDAKVYQTNTIVVGRLSEYGGQREHKGNEEGQRFFHECLFKRIMMVVEFGRSQVQELAGLSWPK